MTKNLRTDAGLLLTLCGLAALQYGWIVWPWLGTVTALANAAFILALLVAWLIHRLCFDGPVILGYGLPMTESFSEYDYEFPAYRETSPINEQLTQAIRGVAGFPPIDGGGHHQSALATARRYAILACTGQVRSTNDADYRSRVQRLLASEGVSEDRQKAVLTQPVWDIALFVAHAMSLAATQAAGSEPLSLSAVEHQADQATQNDIRSITRAINAARPRRQGGEAPRHGR